MLAPGRGYNARVRRPRRAILYLGVRMTFTAHQPPWPCWVEVDLDAIGENVSAIRSVTGGHCKIMAVVKAQAYGHGAVAVARAAVEAGATWLAVARVREGLQLRAAGIEAPVLVLGPADAAELPAAVKQGLRLTVARPDQVRALAGVAGALRTRALIHVKLDTGLSRYGAAPETARALLREASASPVLEIEGLYSHFATADEQDGSFARAQVAAFGDALARLRTDGYAFSLVHMAASAATLGLPESHFDMVRLGISLYGVYPSRHLEGHARLRPALSFHARIARVFTLEPGASVGYGRTYVANRPRRAALVPAGYADGLPRSHSNSGFVLANGRRAPLIGRVSMDQCVADVTECGPVRDGDRVVLIGSQGAENIGIDEFAQRSGTISYEALTSIGYRVPRVYLRAGTPVGDGFLDEGWFEAAKG